eukprot:gene7361-8574_t
MTDTQMITSFKKIEKIVKEMEVYSKRIDLLKETGVPTSAASSLFDEEDELLFPLEIGHEMYIKALRVYQDHRSYIETIENVLFTARNRIESHKKKERICAKRQKRNVCLVGVEGQETDDGSVGKVVDKLGGSGGSTRVSTRPQHQKGNDAGSNHSSSSNSSDSDEETTEKDDSKKRNLKRKTKETPNTTPTSAQKTKRVKPPPESPKVAEVPEKKEKEKEKEKEREKEKEKEKEEKETVSTPSTPAAKEKASTSEKAEKSTSSDSSSSANGASSSGSAANGQIPQGQLVAAREKSSSNWILAKVNGYNAKTQKYEVIDEDEEESKRFSVGLKDIIQLPQPHQLPPTFAASTKVLAMFPDTTTFYPALVVSSQKVKNKTSQYTLHFDDDQGDNGQTPSRRVAAQYVVSYSK